MADYSGTLAAVRALGRRGIPVTVADWRLMVPARWSRFTSRVLSCPDLNRQPEAFVSWLLALGEREPGHVLFATSDDVAWLLTRWRDELSRSFRHYLPDLRAMYAVLNKWRLAEACRAAGIHVPPSFLPRGPDDLARLQRELEMPVVIKPQTQVLFWPHVKGRIVRERSELVPLYDAFRRSTCCAPALLQHDPEAALPILQAYLESGSENIYNLSGFVDASGEFLAIAASRKILQRPRKLGLGLCFEWAEVDADLAGRVAALCRHVGYHGMFEIEFLEADGRHLLIDFNPRLYGELAFEIDRGLDLPYFEYLAAAGEHEALRAAVLEARSGGGPAQGAFCHRIHLEIFMALQRLTGGMSRADVHNWRAWLKRHRGHVSDPVLDREDCLPGLVEIASTLYNHAIHPRSTLRSARER